MSACQLRTLIAPAIVCMCLVLASSVGAQQQPAPLHAPLTLRSTPPAAIAIGDLVKPVQSVPVPTVTSKLSTPVLLSTASFPSLSLRSLSSVNGNSSMTPGSSGMPGGSNITNLVLAANQAAAQLVFGMQPSDFAMLCSNHSLLSDFAYDCTTAVATQLQVSTGYNVSVASAVPGITCSRRRRSLLQANTTTVPINFLMTFPANTTNTTLPMLALIDGINTLGMAALGVNYLAFIPSANLTVTAQLLNLQRLQDAPMNGSLNSTTLPPSTNATNTTLPPLSNATNTSLPPVAIATNTTLPPSTNGTNITLPPVTNATNTSLPPVANATNTNLPPLSNATNTSLPPVANATNTTLPPSTNATNTSLPPVTNATNTTLPTPGNVTIPSPILPPLDGPLKSPPPPLPSPAPPPSPAPVVADNQAVAQLAYVLSPAVFAALCSNATARGAFADDSAAAMAAQLVKSSGSAVSVVGSVPASTCGRRTRALLQASTTMPVNYLITFPPGTNAAAQASQVQSLVTRINTEGVAALGVTSLGPVSTSDITVTAVVVPTTSSSAVQAVGLDSSDDKKLSLSTRLGVGLGVGLGMGALCAAVVGFLVFRRSQQKVAVA